MSIDQGVLTISGETKNDYENQGGRIFHREHTYGKFVRSVRLPENIDENAIDAQFENGILTIGITQQQPPEQKPKQIPIRNASFTSQALDNKNFAYADRGQGEQEQQTESNSEKSKKK